MSKQSSKIAHAAHIKERTKGTSNEVSFSVLHAKANALDGKKDEIEHNRFRKWNPFVLFKGVKRGSLTERSTPVTPSSPVESALQAASKAKQNDPLLSQKLPKSDSLPPAQPKASVFSGVGAALGSFGSLFGRKPASPHLPEVASKPKRSFEEEIAFRKALRKRAKITAVATVCAATACLLAVGGWYGFKVYQAHEGNMAELEQSLALIQEADQVVLQIDELVADPFAVVSVSSEGSADYQGSVARMSEVGDPVSKFSIGSKELTIDASELASAQSQVQGAYETLGKADEKARIASEGLQQPEDKEAASQAVFGSEARQKMLSAALLVIEPVQAAVECMEIANTAWELLVLADEFARESSEMLGQASVEEAQASKEKSKEALSAFQSSYALFEAASSLFPSADFSVYYAYLDKRMAAMSFAIASDDALIARNKEEAVAANDAYLAADAEAVELAKALPALPGDLVRQAYDASVATAVSDYEAARLQAGTADAALRDYLGI